MIARLAMIAALLLPAVAPDDPRPADEGPSIRWRLDGKRVGVEVLGLAPADLADLARPGPGAASWGRLLAVGIEPGSGPLRPIAGRYWIEIEAASLRYEPRFPTDWDTSLVARFDPGGLPRPTPGPIRTARIALRRPPRAPTTRVATIDPASDVLPENLLKFYLHFSGPMSRGEAYRRVRIVDAAGKPLDAPFLEIGEELWNESGTRLTLLLDPGRIKRGLRPREEDGPILEPGKSYALVIDRDWPDAEGRPLVAEVRKPFRAGPADETPPDPRTWTITAPEAGSREPLAVAFPEPLDRAMLDSALVVADRAGRPVPGSVGVAADARGWLFRPDAAWVAGDYRLEVNPELEDLVGNSVARPFEVDVVGPIDPPARAGPALVPFTVRGSRR